MTASPLSLFLRLTMPDFVVCYSRRNQMKMKLYAVRNAEGKWFRRKGYGGYGATWVDDFSKATIYNKIGSARSRVTFFAKTWPEYGIPDLVELNVTSTKVLDETERVEKLLAEG